MAKAKIEQENEKVEALAKAKIEPFDPLVKFNRENNLYEIRMIGRMGAMCVIEMGKRLIFHRSNLPHGDFLKDVDASGLNKSTAYRYMNAAEKLGYLPGLSEMTPSKLYALAEETSEEDIKRLSDGKKVGEVGLDDVDRMTADQLRKALRKEKQKREKVEKEYDELEEKAGTKKTPTTKEIFTQLDMDFFAMVRGLVAFKLKAETEEAQEEIKLTMPNRKGGLTKGDVWYQQMQALDGQIGALLKPRFRQALAPEPLNDPGEEETEKRSA